MRTRIRLFFVYSGIVALSATVPILAGTAAGAAPVPTPSPTPSTLPIGNVKATVTQPGQQPTGATHVEQPPFNK